jgi:hypothetical protein
MRSCNSSMQRCRVRAYSSRELIGTVNVPNYNEDVNDQLRPVLCQIVTDSNNPSIAEARDGVRRLASAVLLHAATDCIFSCNGACILPLLSLWAGSLSRSKDGAHCAVDALLIRRLFSTDLPAGALHMSYRNGPGVSMFMLSQCR